jgi:hypothetical protein
MTTRSKIIGLTRQMPEDHLIEADDGSALITVAEHVEQPDIGSEANVSDGYFEEEYEQAPSKRWGWIVVPTLLLLAFAGWTGFFGWTYFPEVQRGLLNDRVISLIATWAVPTLLIAVLWLIAMRSSSREATRFGDVAASLRSESDALALRMRTVNEEISLAREFLAQNARELETIGRQSSRQLVEAADQLAAALADSDTKAKTLEAVSNAATSNLEQLRKHLPVVTSAAKDVTNQIGSAGNNAQLQIKTLIGSLERVSEAGRNAREYIDNMEIRADEASGKIERSLESSAAMLDDKSTIAVSRATDMATLIGNAASGMEVSIVKASAEIDKTIIESNGRLEGQLSSLRVALSELSGQSVDEQARISGIIDEISNHIEISATRISDVDKLATDQTAKLAFAVSALNESTKNVGSTLVANQGATEQLISRSERLLASLTTASREIDEALPAAMTRLDERFVHSLAQLERASGSAGALDELSDNMLAKLTSLEHLVEVQHIHFAKLMSESDEQFAVRHEQADALGIVLRHTRTLIEQMTEDANDKLVGSLLHVRETTKEAAESSRKILDEELATVAARLTDQNKAALSDAIEHQIAAMNETVRGAVERNIALSEKATNNVAAQLVRLDEMASNLEQRIADSRRGFDGADDDSFARRMVLLTESLNSTAIDVAKILSNDVTDTAWAAYLKGDRGVFTRRAVRLLDAGEARAIAAHYDEDYEFREHVNRYIHDFESMMRVLLSTRDGNAICVTLLSSDVGKLYVALAQAIERLRN